MEHPEILAAQIKGLVSDPTVKQQVRKTEFVVTLLLLLRTMSCCERRPCIFAQR